MKAGVPLIDFAPFRESRSDRVVREIREACAEYGFFLLRDFGGDEGLARKLEAISRDFFARSAEEKLRIAMKHGGPAWRGYFPVGEELTSGKPDEKEGLYFGEELSLADPRVVARTPLHGANLFPEIAGFRETVLAYMAEMRRVGHELMEALSLGLGLEVDYFDRHYTREPTQLFRIFHYPPSSGEAAWGVGEHTDYGVLTLLRQDDCGGLEIRTPGGFVEVEPVPETLVCNVGDMLDLLTHGRYRSAPHRVRNVSGRDRLSLPYFFDPAWNARVAPLPIPPIARTENAERWDRENLYAYQGSYGDYLMRKVAKVFPKLAGV